MPNVVIEQTELLLACTLLSLCAYLTSGYMTVYSTVFITILLQEEQNEKRLNEVGSVLKT